LALIVTAVAELLLARRAAAMEAGGSGGDGEGDGDDLGDMRLSAEERRGLLYCGIVLVAVVAAFAAALAPAGSPLRGPEGTVMDSPVITGIAFLIGIMFMVLGAVFGRTTGSLTRARDIPDAMAQGVRDLAPVMVLFFAASQFLAYFAWTGLGEVIAIRGSSVLDEAGVPVPVLMLGMLVICCLMNLMITSGSALLTLVAPLFVPMVMLLAIPPETTMAVSRVADSTTNVISPMSPYFAMALGFLQRYRRDAGIGTLLSMTLPLSVCMLIGWTLLLMAWWALGVPLGPGAPVR